MRPIQKKVRYYNPKRRAIMLAGDDIDPVELFEMHNWVCHLCKETIERHRRCPDKLAATIDHILPLSRGGKHTWDNVAPAHALCNFKKSDGVAMDIVPC